MMAMHQFRKPAKRILRSRDVATPSEDEINEMTESLYAEYLHDYYVGCALTGIMTKDVTNVAPEQVSNVVHTIANCVLK